MPTPIQPPGPIPERLLKHTHPTRVPPPPKPGTVNIPTYLPLHLYPPAPIIPTETRERPLPPAKLAPATLGKAKDDPTLPTMKLAPVPPAPYDVSCPVCGALPGAWCVRKRTKQAEQRHKTDRTHPHRERRVVSDAGVPMTLAQIAGELERRASRLPYE